MRVLSVCLAIMGFCACSDLPPTPAEMQTKSNGIATWDSIEASTHTKASRPPEPVLIVDRKEKSCFKVYSVFPQEYRLPNGQAYSLRDCKQDCGTSIQCPSWAQEVYIDLERRTRKKKATDARASEKTEAAEKPGDTENQEAVEAPKPSKSSKTIDVLGPPPTDAPEKTVQQ